MSYASWGRDIGPSADRSCLGHGLCLAKALYVQQLSYLRRIRCTTGSSLIFASHADADSLVSMWERYIDQVQTGLACCESRSARHSAMFNNKLSCRRQIARQPRSSSAQYCKKHRWIISLKSTLTWNFSLEDDCLMDDFRNLMSKKL